MRKKLIAGNWKMNLDVHQASTLLHRLEENIEIHQDVEVAVFPSHLFIQPLNLQVNRRKMKLGAQDAFYEDEGAYTGAVSAHMLHGLVDYVIIGHSERRHKFGETDDEIRKKLAAAFRNKITPVLCVGETAVERSEGETKQVLHDQVMSDLLSLTTKEVETMVIAYEPVWAVSDGKDYQGHKMPTPDDVKEAVDTIRHNVRELYGKTAEENLRVLYGGSTNTDNARAYLDVEGVDGLLVGGASLNYHQFTSIVKSAHDAAGE
jgi:triosephosphate isomerase